PVIKGFSVKPDFDQSSIKPYSSVSAILLDTWNEKMYGGTGKTFDWMVAKSIIAQCDNVILSGGLGPANLEEALETVWPYGVDINSGVEIRPGIKNPIKMRDAVNIVHKCRKIY
ncbi:MAG: phosphoribosylanthranilate isomerase, partial [Fibrobacter sp.]|nr:phosphoribosylanthranilate isomerase [Fibrobacter sp.]